MAQKIRLDLSKFKASGVYTLEFDQSENIILTQQTIRLVVGFSKKGPFNSPVFCPDIKTARRVFGDIDSSLERKGSFFHRELFTCLQTGPVFALNLLALNDDSSGSPDTSDKINYISFSVDTMEDNGNLTSKLFSSFYNKERFWFPDPSYFLATTSTVDADRLLHFTNLGKKPMSVLVVKSDVTGYDLTAQEWYATGGQEKPEWMNDADYISDFFLDVIAIEGDWTDYAALSVDPVYSTYFNSRGIIKEQLDAFISLPEITTIASVTGTIIPDFIDKNDTNQYLQTIINNTVATTGMFLAVNESALDDLANNSSELDLVGHNLIAGIATREEIDMISYHAPLINDYEYADNAPTYVVAGSPYTTLVAPEGTNLYADWLAGIITDADYIIKDALGTKQYLKFFPGVDGFGDPYVEIRAYDSVDFTSQENVAAFGSTYDSGGSLVATNINIVSIYGTYNEYVSTETPDPTKPALTSNQFIVAAASASKVPVGDLVVTSSGDRLTRIKTVAKYNTAGDVLVTCDSPVKVYSSNRIQKFERLQDFVQEFNFHHLAGFTLLERHQPNGTGSRMNEILDVLYDTNLASTLKNKDAIDFRYVVDTFNHGLEPNSKWRLAKLAKLRQKALAICNTPSIKEFINSTDPRFTDEPTASNPKPLLNTRYISTGGNLSLNPSFTYSLVDEELGSKFVGYFSPNLILRQGGKNISVPPAAHVSNNFINKFINGTPYAIVAGSNRGLISDPNLVGVEYEFDQDDRDYLEPFGINPIIRKGGLVQIYANQTGFQRVNSAFNNLHVRDLLITIENDIETILDGYVFEFNDASIRLEIKTKVDNYLEGVQAAGGIYDFVTIMDTSNNTPEVIDQNIGIIDVILEPARGIHKFINRVTVVRTGAVASGGFTIA